MSSAYRLKNISYQRNGQKVLDIPELEVQADRVTVLLGSNGAGKSTLLQLLAFLDKTDTGTIFYHGERIDGSNQAVIRHRVGLVLQNPYLLRGTVADNVECGLKFRGYPARQRRIKTRQVLTEMGINSLALRPVHKLSGGEAQMVAMARTRVLEPEVLLLDEPFVSLDQTGTNMIAEYIRCFINQGGRTLLFSTHDRVLGLSLADDVISLMNGKLMESPC